MEGNELKKYRGLWVAVYKGKVIASGKETLQVPRKEEEVCIL